MNPHTQTEARHLLRKHVIMTQKIGKSGSVAKCTECGANGVSVPSAIQHDATCRYANLMMRFGETVYIREKKMVEAPDLDSCTS